MAEISRFLGMVVAMFYREHPPPHFHATCGEHRIRVNILTGEILSGYFPKRTQQLVLVLWKLHREELLEDWVLAGFVWAATPAFSKICGDPIGGRIIVRIVSPCCPSIPRGMLGDDGGRESGSGPPFHFCHRSPIQ